MTARRRRTPHASPVDLFETNDFRERARHGIAGHLHTGCVQPCMGFQPFQLVARGYTEMQHARHASAPQHLLGGDCLRQAYRLERHMACGARYCPADFSGEVPWFGIGQGCGRARAVVCRRRDGSQMSGDTPERHNEQNDSCSQQPHRRFKKKYAATGANLTEPAKLPQHWSYNAPPCRHNWFIQNPARLPPFRQCLSLKCDPAR